MDANGKLTRKPNRFLLGVIVTITLVMLLQCLAFEKRWYRLESGFGSWSLQSKLKLREEGSSLQELLENVANCSPSVFAGRDQVPAEEIQCLRNGLVNFLANDTLVQLKSRADQIAKAEESKLKQETEQLKDELKLAKEHLQQMEQLKNELKLALQGTEQLKDEFKLAKEHLQGTEQLKNELKLAKERLQGTEQLQSELKLTEERLQGMQLLNSELKLAKERLQQSVTMMELKDLKEPGLTHGNRTWFMSSVGRQAKDGYPEEFRFPSDLSQGRLLCLQGNDTRNGTRNSYGFAWRDYLPRNATVVPGLTIVADNYWDYGNPWHSMSALVSFALWRSRNGCPRPDKLVIYHWGEVVPKMGDWITNVLHATLGRQLTPETFSWTDGRPVCLEDAIVNRRGLGGLSRPNSEKLFDMVRCKVHKYCKVEPKSYLLNNKGGRIDLTIVARTGAREFSNLTGVEKTVSEQCKLVAGCQVNVVRISNMTFCQQVELMSKTDILLTAHGAQLTNMMFMPKGGSVMEMFPKGWLELAGVGQYIYSWLSDWTGLQHEGTWRDPEGPACPLDPSKERLKCFMLFKDRPVGLNQSQLAAWTADVLQRLRSRSAPAGAAAADCECDATDKDVFSSTIV